MKEHMNSISVSDMHRFVENMDSGLSISPNIGNVIELNEKLDDDLGISLLSNSNSRPVEKINPYDAVNDIEINSLEPLESISFDMPTSMHPLPEFNINREEKYPSIFLNEQSSSGPSIQTSDANHLTVEEERKKKTELLNKLTRLQAKGYTLSKRFTMDNSLDEIQQEFDRLWDAKSLEASLKFQRQCMMGIVTGAEFLNSKFNPFDWEIDGWSESVHENIEDFDEVFEELYDKYKGRGNMPPEIKLCMSLVGSGFMFHMSNSFFRSKMGAMDPAMIFKNNPQLAKQFASAAAQQAGSGFGNFMGAAMGVNPPETGSFYQAPAYQQPYNTPQQIASNQPVQQPRREMKGPSGVDDILKTFQEVRAAEMEFPPQINVQSQPHINMSSVSSMAESLHSSPMSSMSMVGSTNQRTGRRRKVNLPVENTVTLNL